MTGFEPQHKVHVKCYDPPDIFEFDTLLCLPICRDPVTGNAKVKERNGKYKIEQIISYESVANGRISIPVTIGCRCVLVHDEWSQMEL